MTNTKIALQKANRYEKNDMFYKDNDIITYF